MTERPRIVERRRCGAEGLALAMLVLLGGCVQDSVRPVPGNDSDAVDASDAGAFDSSDGALDVPSDPEADPVAEPDLDASDAVDAPDVNGDLAEVSPDMQDADADIDPDVAAGPALYPADRTHSPITAHVAENLRAIAARRTDRASDVFMKVGDSITVSQQFLHCLQAADVEFPGRPDLAETHAFFRLGDAAGSTPFDRESLAAEVGRSASWAISGDPTPLEQELVALSPQFAVVMYGTNDIGYFTDDMARMFRWYTDALWRLVDRLIDEGVVPILSTIPPRDDSAFLDRWVPTMNAVIRGLAQGRQIPLVDFHREMLPLPDHGLGGDGVHPNVYWPAGGPNACDFTSAGLDYGYNVRNLVTVEALDRARRVVVDLEPAPDAAEANPMGDGSPSSPFRIDRLPFADLRDTTESPHSNLDAYPDCSAGQDESGPEYLYRLDVAETVRVRGLVLDVGSVDIDLHLLDETAAPSGCLARNDSLVQGTLGPGTYYFALDTFVSSDTTPHPGEYLFVLVSCESGDPACDTALSP